MKSCRLLSPTGEIPARRTRLWQVSINTRDHNTQVIIKIKRKKRFTQSRKERKGKKEEKSNHRNTRNNTEGRRQKTLFTQRRGEPRWNLTTPATRIVGQRFSHGRCCGKKKEKINHGKARRITEEKSKYCVRLCSQVISPYTTPTLIHPPTWLAV